ncbi:MAG TPA: helix-hairpin-helix domain-containing protein [Patescibacteria group bacterium]|nr:helix-hairpin-helix domain-containing protein [Patescibacteria group bacterium]
MEQVREILKKLPKQVFLPLGLACAGLILLVYGFVLAKPPDTTRENDAQAQFSQPTQGPAVNLLQEKVDIEGSVVSAGVYSLPTTSRVQDALVAAGGLSSTADREWVAKHVNLATKLTDGMKIYIPKQGESGSDAISLGTASIDGQNKQTDINSASLFELDALPGIGLVTAQKIIDARPYTTSQDLVTKHVLSSSAFAKIKDVVVAQ